MLGAGVTTAGMRVAAAVAPHGLARALIVAIGSVLLSGVVELSRPRVRPRAVALLALPLGLSVLAPELPLDIHFDGGHGTFHVQGLIGVALFLAAGGLQGLDGFQVAAAEAAPARPHGSERRAFASGVRMTIVYATLIGTLCMLAGALLGLAGVQIEDFELSTTGAMLAFAFVGARSAGRRFAARVAA
jgi:hypothetical protein